MIAAVVVCQNSNCMGAGCLRSRTSPCSRSPPACSNGGMPTELVQARWWGIRPAQNEKAASYTCPFCDGRLHAMSEHMLIAPENDVSRRRHAHTDCVLRAR